MDRGSIYRLCKSDFCGRRDVGSSRGLADEGVLVPDRRATFRSVMRGINTAVDLPLILER